MFFHPLKRPENIHVIEPALVDEIFYMIPEILENHEHFLEDLSLRVENWDDDQIIGDLFVTQVWRGGSMSIGRAVEEPRCSATPK